MATELGKAYVQIMPSAKGISKEITKTLGPESTKAGQVAGTNIVSSIKKVIAAAGIGKALVDTIKQGGALEQSIGGIETLFKDDADTVRKYANEHIKLQEYQPMNIWKMLLPSLHHYCNHQVRY